jgi:hypothetical protein
MASLEDVVKKQNPGTQFVISGQMLRLSPK